MCSCSCCPKLSGGKSTVRAGGFQRRIPSYVCMVLVKRLLQLQQWAMFSCGCYIFSFYEGIIFFSVFLQSKILILVPAYVLVNVTSLCLTFTNAVISVQNMLPKTLFSYTVTLAILPSSFTRKFNVFILKALHRFTLICLFFFPYQIVDLYFWLASVSN